MSSFVPLPIHSKSISRVAWVALWLLVSLSLGCDKPSSTEKPTPQSAVDETASNAEEAAAPELPVAAPAQRPDGPLPRFVDITEASGIHFERYDDIRGLHRIQESTGGGVALFDFDGDGLLDVLLTNGCTLPRKYSDDQHASQLYRNLGHNRFVAVTDPCGFKCGGYAQGVAVGDFNSDGFEDFYIAAYGRNSLWHNNGDGTFTDVTEETGAADPRWSTSAAFADFNGDGMLDLYVVNYVEASDDPPKLCPNKASPDGYVQCPPTIFPAVDDLLLISDGSGRFRDATKSAGINGEDGKGLSAIVFDADLDGRPDIFVANDGTPNFLYKNVAPAKPSEPGQASELQFQEQSSLQGVALNYEGKAQACMGIACGDYDQDGFLDLFVTNFFAETNTLYRNLGGKGYEDATNPSRLGPPSRPMLAFGTEFIDFDNDSWLDLVVANGHIDDLTWANPDEAYLMPPQFFRNDGNGAFTDVSQWSGEYFTKDWLGRGLAVGDLDNDGDQDFVVSHQLAPSAVVSNQTESSGQSVTIRLIGRQSNRSAVNARVEAQWPEKTIVREVVGGGSFQASSDRRVHLGLGKEGSIPKLIIRWPSGMVDQWENVTAGSYHAIEGQEIARAVTWPAED